MKSAILLMLTAVILCSWLTADAAMPIYLPYTSITFYDNGKEPLVSGKAVMGTITGIYVQSLKADSLKGTHVIITSLRISGDSLLISINPDSGNGEPPIIPLAGTDLVAPELPENRVIFDKMGIYNAYTIDISPCYGPTCGMPVFVGAFRILPQVGIEPAVPKTGDSVGLQLNIGQTHGDPCVAYSSSSVIKDNKIYLSYQELGMGRPCLPIYYEVPVKYGPYYELGTLPAGTYELYIEDTVAVGSIVVRDILIVNGYVTIMQSPFIDAPARPVAGALVSAVKAPQCPGPWIIEPAAVAETLWTTTNASGSFTLSIPFTNEDYMITVTKPGFHLQTIYSNNYPLAYSYPPQLIVSFELLEDTIEAITDVEVTVKLNSAPCESAFVTFYGGREPLMCPMYKALAKTSSLIIGQYTDAQGKINYTDVSMNPYIDYVYSARKYLNGKSYTKRGLIRLNKYMDNKLVIDLEPVGIEASVSKEDNPAIKINPNPFNPFTTIRLPNINKSARVSIYDVSGKLVKQFKNIQSDRITWNANGLANGIYILKVKMGNRHFAKRLIFAR